MYVMYHESEDMSEMSRILDHVKLELQPDLIYIEQQMVTHNMSVKILKKKIIALILSIVEWPCP